MRLSPPRLPAERVRSVPEQNRGLGVEVGHQAGALDEVLAAARAFTVGAPLEYLGVAPAVVEAVQVEVFCGHGR
jgi:hypothetical protein